MPESGPPPITAASLRARDEWRRGVPGARVVWEEDADEGDGIGFDGLDPSAMVRAFLKTASPWAAVLEWYRELLAELGWERKAVRGDWWWEWTSPEHSGELVWVLDRTRALDGSALRTPEDELLFEVLFKARGAFSAARWRNA